MKKVLAGLALVPAVLGVMLGLVLTAALLLPASSVAHTGTPSPTTFGTGTVLTAQQLNDTFSHIHNTFSAGIVDAHISTSAAISHAKLATPALVAKAVLSTTTPCVGAGATGTDCTVGVEYSKFFATSGGAGSGNSALEAAGGGATSGIYQLTLSYTPTNTNFMVEVSSGTAGTYCAVTARATSAPHIQITCRNDAGTATDTNLNIAVFDTD